MEEKSALDKVMEIYREELKDDKYTMRYVTHQFFTPINQVYYEDLPLFVLTMSQSDAENILRMLNGAYNEGVLKGAKTLAFELKNILKS